MMDYERMSFPEAVELLSRLAGLEVPREEGPQTQQQVARRRRIKKNRQYLKR